MRPLLKTRMTNTRDQLITAILATFPQSDPAAILSILDLYGLEPYERETERVRLAIIHLADGNEDQLRYFVQIAKTDYRDVLHWQAGGPLTPEQGEQAQQAALALIERWGKK